MPQRELARRHPPQMVKLHDPLEGPASRWGIECRFEVLVEQLAAGSHQQLIEGAEQSRIAARKQKPVKRLAVDPLLAEKSRHLDQFSPAARNGEWLPGVLEVFGRN